MVGDAHPTLELPFMDPGLCGSCLHAKVLRNERGSAFYMCGLAEKDPRFRRYPPLPVRQCEGFQEKKESPNECEAKNS